MSLQDFLNSNPVEGATTEVAISQRFRDQEGKLMKFTIKAMSQSDFEALRKKATKITFENGGQKLDFNSGAFNLGMIIDHTVNPNFKDAASIQKLGCATPEQYINKVLLAGEVNELSNQINTFSGFNVNIQALIDEAKN